MASFRVLKAELSQITLGRITAAFPPSLLNASLLALAGGTVDVSLKAIAGAGPMITDAVAIALSDPATGLAVPLHTLPDPVTITFPLPAPLAGPQESYQCVVDAGGTWETEGVWLTLDADAVQCHTTRLSTVTVLPVVRVHQVQVLLSPLLFWAPGVGPWGDVLLGVPLGLGNKTQEEPKDPPPPSPCPSVWLDLSVSVERLWPYAPLPPLPCSLTLCCPHQLWRGTLQRSGDDCM